MKPSRRWRKPLAVVAALAAAGVLVYSQRDAPVVRQAVTSHAPSLLGGYSDVPQASASAPTVTKQLPPQVAPTPAMQARAEQYRALTVPGASDEMLSKAYRYASDCVHERLAYQGGLQFFGKPVETPVNALNKCALGPGDPDNVTWKRILAARVHRVDFGAIVDVQGERTGAFADDPAQWRALMEEAYRTGLEQSEPVVLAGEYVTETMRADALRAAGQEAEAMVAYRQAAIYAVASAVNKGREVGMDFDVRADNSVVIAFQHIPQGQQEAVIAEGRTLAQKWRKS